MLLRNYWYVAAQIDEIGEKPLARTILNEPVVIAQFPDGTVAAFEDACPHRRFPLSKGRMIEEGLQCGYHGLTFGPDGGCTLAPYDDRIPVLAKTKTYPLQKKYGWYWIWMGDPELADETPVSPLLDQYYSDEYVHVYGYHYVKGNYELLIDNLLDLTHVDIVHVGVLGFKIANEGRS